MRHPHFKINKIKPNKAFLGDYRKDTNQPEDVVTGLEWIGLDFNERVVT